MERINVTKTFLPPIEDYQRYLDEIWTIDQLTNQGPLLKQLEKELEGYLGVDNLHFVANGTLALQLALKALDISEGEIITTPFSYVATTSAILWERCQPVFVDIEPETFCIDASKIEAAITDKTRAIMAVHVFGYPCDVEAIETIAKKRGLKVIYDGAHAFGVKYKGRSILDYGDVSICSFHATKLFHTVEGGAIITRSKSTSDKVELIKRFGHNFDEHIILGINAKASEFHAAMGLCNLKYIDTIIDNRRGLVELYDQLLGNKFKKPIINEKATHNAGYYPLVMKDEAELKRAIEALNAANIFPRRYFYPSLNTLPYLATTRDCPISEDISKRIICLPLYYKLDTQHITKICQILNDLA